MLNTNGHDPYKTVEVRDESHRKRFDRIHDQLVILYANLGKGPDAQRLETQGLQGCTEVLKDDWKLNKIALEEALSLPAGVKKGCAVALAHICVVPPEENDSVPRKAKCTTRSGNLLLHIKHIVPLNCAVPMRRFRPPGFARGIWNGYLPRSAIPHLSGPLQHLLHNSVQKAKLNAAGEPTMADTVSRYDLC